MPGMLRIGCNSQFCAIRGLIRNESGGTMIEYALVVALIALSQVTVMGNVGTSLSEVFNRIAADL